MRWNNFPLKTDRYLHNVHKLVFLYRAQTTWFSLMAVSSVLLALNFGSKLSNSDKAAMPEFAFSWMDGEVATIKIRALNNFDKLDRNAFKPTLTANGKIGNSSFASGVFRILKETPLVGNFS